MGETDPGGDRQGSVLRGALSAEAILSNMLRQELALAHERRRGGALRILPVRMDSTGNLGYDLASYVNPLQYAPWRAGEPFASVIEEVGGPSSLGGAEP